MSLIFPGAPTDEPRWRSLAQLLDRGRDEGVYSAAVALVGLQGELRWQGVTGRVSRDPASPPATPDTIFDLASLTKPLATTLALMLLEARGLVSPRDHAGGSPDSPLAPPGQALPDLKEPPGAPVGPAGPAPLSPDSGGGPRSRAPPASAPLGRGGTPGV